jgi:HTH-type transcriptional regulator/antitoxin HipB
MQRNARTPAQIGPIVRRERRARGLTQAQLGAKIGRRQATISKLEKGEPATQLSTLFDVLTALNLELVIGDRSKLSKTNFEQIF